MGDCRGSPPAWDSINWYDSGPAKANIKHVLTLTLLQNGNNTMLWYSPERLPSRLRQWEDEEMSISTGAHQACLGGREQERSRPQTRVQPSERSWYKGSISLLRWRTKVFRGRTDNYAALFYQPIFEKSVGDHYTPGQITSSWRLNHLMAK